MKQLGDYELMEQLGRGGMGIVYKARHVRLKKIVALKILPQKAVSDPRSISRFQREMELIGRVDHPNIVRALDAREENGIYFLVMEYIDGCDLDQLVRKHGALPPVVACTLIRHAAIGLQHAHSHDLVHRDIKPSNLMGNSTGIIKILDLGLARFHVSEDSAQPLTQPGLAMGTIDYMAPEQWEDSTQVDIRADIYSLGCTFYYLLTGRPPYTGPSLDSVKKRLMAHVISPIPKVSDFVKNCPAGLDDVLKKMLGKEPEERYATPTEVVDALKPFSDRIDLSSFFGEKTDQKIPSSEVHTESILASSIVDTKPQHTKDSDVVLKETTIERSSISSRTLSGLFSTPRRRAVTISLLSIFIIGSIVTLLMRGPSEKMLNARAELISLPGLNGRWWFEETPWYTPSLRAELGEKFANSHQFIGGFSLSKLADSLNSNNTQEIYKELRKICSKLNRKLPEREWTWFNQLTLNQQEKLGEGKYRDRLKSLADNLSSVSNRSATESHLLGNLQHKLANWEEAEKHYLIAKKIYDQNNQAELQALVRFDLGQMYFDRKQGHDAMDKLISVQNLNPAFLLKIATLIQEAKLQQLLGFSDTSVTKIREARQLLEENTKHAVNHFDNHPLMAELYHREGWAYLNQWETKLARQAFGKSNKILIYQVNEFNNYDAPRNLLWVLQGIAMTYFFESDFQSAYKNYSSLLKNIESEKMLPGISNSESELTPLQKYEYRQRKPNLYERLADCYLFASEPSQENLHAAIQDLTDAIQQAKVLQFTEDGRAVHVVRLYYKLAIAYLMAIEQNTSKLPPIYESSVHEKATSKDFKTKIYQQAAYLIREGQNLESKLESEKRLTDVHKKLFHAEKEVANSLVDLIRGDSSKKIEGLKRIENLISNLGQDNLTRQNLSIHVLAFQKIIRYASTLDKKIFDNIVKHKLLAITQSADKGIIIYMKPLLKSTREKVRKLEKREEYQSTIKELNRRIDAPENAAELML